MVLAIDPGVNGWGKRRMSEGTRGWRKRKR